VVAHRINWKGCHLSWTALPYTRFKEIEWFNPQRCPLFGGRLEKIFREKSVSPVRVPKQDFDLFIDAEIDSWISLRLKPLKIFLLIKSKRLT
jgi:hypothetical protein